MLQHYSVIHFLKDFLQSFLMVSGSSYASKFDFYYGICWVPVNLLNASGDTGGFHGAGTYGSDQWD